jgi:hypothetical protein
MRWLIVGVALAVSTTSMAYDFHDRNATPSQIAAFEQGMRSLYPDHPDKAKAVIDEQAQRRKETLRETAFRHMVELCENLEEEKESDAAASNAAVARCNAATSYYRTIRDDQDVLRYEGPAAHNP